MRILIVSTHDSRGGAGKAAYLFSKEFKNQGNEVCLYVKSKKEKEDFIIESKSPNISKKLFHLLDFLPGYILSGFNSDANFTLGMFGGRLEKVIEDFKPDIINVHWTWKGFVSFQEICRVSRNIPVVWTMHDISPFSGGLFYPSLKKQPFIKLLTKINNRIRRRSFKESNITFVSPSQFLFDEFNKSEIGKASVGKKINNGTDLSIFKKQNKEELRKKIGLSSEKRYILFGAVNFVDNEVKGGVFLKKILEDIQDYLLNEDIGLISFGSQDPFQYLDLHQDIEKKFFGYVDSAMMAKLNSASDIMLVSSRYENYPFVVMESICCGTPVIAFNVGGISEIIDSKEKGLVVEPFVLNDYEEGIKDILNNKNIHDSDLSEYDVKTKAVDYIQLFNDCFKAGRS